MTFECFLTPNSVLFYFIVLFNQIWRFRKFSLNVLINNCSASFNHTSLIYHLFVSFATHDQMLI